MNYRIIFLGVAALAALAAFPGCADKKQQETRAEIKQAMAMMDVDNYIEAVNLLEKSLKHERSADAYLLLGEAYRGIRESSQYGMMYLPREIAALEASVAINGKNIRSLKFLAEAQFANRQYDSARKTYLKILTLNPPEYEQDLIKEMISECDSILARMATPAPPQGPDPGDETGQ